MTNTRAEPSSPVPSEPGAGNGSRWGIRDRIGQALLSSADAPLVLVGNFEVEDRWAIGEVGLPRLNIGNAGRPIVNQLDEFALLLGAAADHVVVKSAPDEGYLNFLGELGFPMPTVVCPSRQDPQHTVTEDVLADPATLATLAELGQRGHHLLPHGVSDLEEKLVADTGLALATPSAATCKAVNSKIYSRVLAEELGLRQAGGHTATTVAEFSSALRWARDLLCAGRRVVVKDAFGVSGRGVLVVDDVTRLDRLDRLVTSAARRSGTEATALVVEEWVAKRTDLNYHLTIGTDSSVSFDFVMEAITEHGVHSGHRLPARLTRRQSDELAETVALIGARLAADGYRGVAGVDAMIDPAGGLYPIVEINARNNMSTYQAVCRQRLVDPGNVATAKYYPMRRSAPLSFAQLRTVLGASLYDPARRQGFAVNNFATVNAGFPDGFGQEAAAGGRLYGLLVARTPEQLAELEADVATALRAVQQERTP